MSIFLRQLDIIDPKRLVYPVTCIGLGGIGSFTAVALRKMGFSNFVLYDKDEIEAHNVPCQNFGYRDIGVSKVQALGNTLRNCLDDKIEIRENTARFTGDEFLEGIVVSGVDSMESRKAIWRAIKTKSCSFVPCYVDCRIGIEWDDEEKRVTGEWIEVFTINPSSVADIELYESHLFDDAEATPLHCTAQAVVYVGYFVAGFAASNIKKWICGEKYYRHLLYDALTLDRINVTE